MTFRAKAWCAAAVFMAMGPAMVLASLIGHPAVVGRSFSLIGLLAAAVAAVYFWESRKPCRHEAEWCSTCKPGLMAALRPERRRKGGAA